MFLFVFICKVNKFTTTIQIYHPSGGKINKGRRPYYPNKKEDYTIAT